MNSHSYGINVALALLMVVASACSTEESLFEAENPNSNVLGSVEANTELSGSALNASLHESTGSFKLAGVTSGVANCTTSSSGLKVASYYFNGPNLTLRWEDFKYVNCSVYGAGRIEVKVIANGVTRYLNPLQVDIIRDHYSVSPIPSGGRAEIKAVPNTGDGCRFLGWRVAGSSMFTTNTTFNHYSNTPYKLYIGEFECPGGDDLP